MASDWCEVRLEDITSKIGDGLHGTPKYDENGDYYFINGNNISNGKIEINDNTKRVSYEEYFKHKKDLNDRTILVSINGTLGNVGIYNHENVCLGKSACYLNIVENVDKQFVKYVLSSSLFQDYIHIYATGTTIKNMGLKAMRDFTFNLPSPEVQKQIADILSSLDDKIALNREMNKTLESMAQAVFKSWFVDFEPFKEGEFVESNLGMIPKGWAWKKFAEILVPKKGKSITKSATIEGNIPVVAGGLTPAYYHNQYNAKAPVITISASGANAGFVNLYNQNIWASDCSYIDNTMTDFVYSVYLFLKYKQCEITSMQQGAAQPHIYPSDLMRLDIADAEDTSLWKLLEESIKPIFEKIGSNEKEIQTLSTLRDTLLPKLLSGELAI